MHIYGVDLNKNEIEKWVELKLNSAIYSHFGYPNFFWDMMMLSEEIRQMLYDLVRGSQNASAVIPHLPFWSNSEKRCVELAARQIAHRNGTVECQPNCFHVRWEEALYQAFAANCKLVKRKECVL